MSFPAYPEYKDSGVVWLGEVPSHWDVLRLKRIFELKKRAVHEDDGIVTAFRDGVVTLRSNRRIDGFTNAIHEIGYQGVNVDDLVIHAMDAFAGAIGVSDSCGKATPVYSVCTSRSSHNSTHYFAHLLRSMALRGYISALSKGVRERSTEFRWSEAGEVLLLQPSEKEQFVIVKFLTHETAKIDALIAEQEKLIELLKEKRHAVISHAVTKGLDPNAPMKDSGVEWLGQVPEHWGVCSLGYNYEVLLGKMLDEKRVTGEYLRPYLRNTDVQWDSICVEDLPQMDFHPDERPRYALKYGDLLVCEGGDVGRAAIWTSELSECYYQKALHRIRSKSGNENVPRFLFYILRYAVGIGLFLGTSGKATIAHLTAEALRSYSVPFPPKDEQERISTYLDEKCHKMGLLEAESQKAITLLKERRSALISAAVTGKIDVRGYAPQQEAV